MSKFSRRQFVSTSILSASAIALGQYGCSPAINANTPPLSNQKEATKSNQTDILAIGAGVAGLAAAKNLSAEGYKVIVLEARDRIGGRIRTDNSLGVPIDLGAAWIHRKNGNPITKLAQQFQIQTLVTDFDAIALYGSDGKSLSQSEIEQIELAYKEVESEISKLRIAANESDNESLNTSLEEAVSKILATKNFSPKTLQGINWQLASQIEIENGASLSELALKTHDEDLEFTGMDLVFPKGYIQIVNGLAQGLDIRLGITANKVEYNAQGVSISTSQGTFQSDRAIITVPLGVLKQGSIAFEPPLPQAKLQAIQHLGMGALNKVVLKFPKQFWDESPHFIGLLKDNRSQIMDYWNWQKYVDVPVLAALVGGTYSRELEKMPLDRVVGIVIADLKMMFGSSIPEPTHAIATQWHSDPLSRGSYSIMPRGSSLTDREVLAEPVGDRLFFAGEATHKAYPSSVHGAFLSGEREAKRIASLAR
ncbi:FAD-dependent oxidoreductase [Tumidithrix helvetica PCC 7403]|uniref:flavin monoamine oxidase family protein n=1 Tax=Tumidithrix helvetica TaxID=3457545 RepID=UPI003CC0CC39